jgi:hypothetical protein
MGRPVTATDSAATSHDRQARFLIALGRVGSTPEERFKWLQDFVSRNLSGSSSADAARWEVLAFAETGWGHQPAPPRPDALRRLARAVSVGNVAWADPEEDVSREVRWVQHKVHQALRRLADDRRWALPLPDHEYILSEKGEFVPVPRVDPEKAADVRNWFFGAVLRLLAALGSRLRVCANDACRTLFPGQPGQAYCSTICSGRVRQKRFRERHPDKMRDSRHEVYAQKQKDRLGPNVKVRRQQRRSRVGAQRSTRAGAPQR